METNYPLKLWVYTFCYNEEKILPYVIEYWKQYATKVIVYDNGSTDNSLKILSQYSWIEVREFDTENTFDPEKISQYKSFCYADAIGKTDYVMVCDIDEVLLPTENLLPELILAKKDNVQLFQTKYYEIINNELNPKYDSLIHTAEGYYAYPNPNIHKAIIFDPQIKISFGNNSLIYTTNRNYKTESIIVFHLKLFNANIFTERQKHLISRMNKKYKFKDSALYYGNEKNLGTRLSFFKLASSYKYKFDKKENYITIVNDAYTLVGNAIKFKDLTWLPTEINHNSKSSNNECIFGIPIYKSDLSTIEKASLTQLCKIIQNKFEICLICPEDLNLRAYVDIAEKYDVKLSTLFCAKQYFMGTASYSYMCETADFYKCFSEYKYLFIYQLDGWIFEDNVQKYLDLDVDYIGSPWNVGSFNLPCDTIGNGGVSLRKVQKFIDVCNSFTPEDYEKDWVKTEDLFFCKTMKAKANFKLPTVQVGSNFSLCGLWGRFMTKYNDGKLPMCLHGWHRDYSSYWKRYINLDEFETTGDIKIVQQPIQPVQKSDYKTRLELIKMRLNKSNKPINIQAPAKIENTKIENKKEITQKTTMSSGYANFYKDYYGIKKPMKWETSKQTTTQQGAKPAVLAKKVEEKKVEVKQEIIDPNQRINILIVHYNTPYLTECLIKSINKFVGYNCTIYIFDNSDKEPFTYKQSNIKIFDNTKGQIINFDEELKKYPNKCKEASGKYISYRHCISVDKCFDLIKDHFILLDSDILLKQNILPLYNKNVICTGDIIKCFDNNTKIDRIAPFCCFINLNECKKRNIRYFDMNQMHGLTKKGHSYDTGAAFYYKIKNLKYNTIHLDDYIIHYKGASWGINLPSNTKIHGSLTPQQWLDINKKYFEPDILEGISICISAYNAKKYIKETLDSISAQTWFKNHNNYEILLGIDGDEDTLEYIKTIMNNYKNLKVFMMNSNQGTYITSNTLMKIAKYDKLMRFDSDDIMNENCIEILLNNFVDCDFLRFYMQTFGEKNNLQVSYGQHIIKKSIFDKFGGYQPWRCAADAEIVKRLENFIKEKTIKDVVFKRRIHNESLTMKPGELQLGKNMGSKRQEYINIVNNMKITKKEDAIIKCTTNTYKIIENNTLNIEKIIITMTSWKKRINNIKPILEDLLKNQIKKPNLININLSSEEFPNKEQELPNELLNFINNNNIIQINWVDGPNIKQWKKILPTLQKYPNDVIICIDDDFIYPNDLISTFYNKHLEFPNNPISGNTVKMFGVKCHCGCASLVKNEYFTNIQQYIKDNKLYNFYSSDIFFTYVAEKSKHPYIYVGKQFFTNMKTYQENDALSKQVHNGTGISDTWNYLIKTYGKI